jgi:hypothetical protein
MKQLQKTIIDKQDDDFAHFFFKEIVANGVNFQGEMNSIKSQQLRAVQKLPLSQSARERES